MKTEFQNPGIKYRSKPFWAWNGTLKEEELLRQMDILKEMGFGGAFIHSRVGLKTEYMGEDWMQLVDRCLCYGKKIGLEMWIYDEDRWPSGTAGGLVTEKPENRSRRLQMHILNQKQERAFFEENRNKLVAAFTCKLEGYEYRDLRRYDSYDDSLMADEKILAITEEESSFNDNYNGYTYLDTLKESAVEDYLSATHDRYRESLSEEAFSLIAGSFTDEPHRGAFLCDFSEGNQLSVPYTEELFPLFSERYGYDLRDHLPEIFFRPEGEPFSRTVVDYLDLVEELFLKNYLGKYRERCQKYGWKFTGHLLHEDSLSTQTCMLGSLMRGYAYFDVPGIDLLGEKTNCWWIGKQLSSVAHQLGKTEMLTELFGCTGWQMKFSGYKAIGDWQALMGINVFCPHLSWYSMEGENKRDYPASIFYQSAWYKEYKSLEDYFARLHVVTEGPPSDCRLLVLSPVKSVWARAYSGAFQWIISKDENIREIERKYEETFRILMRCGIDFDYCDENLLAEYGSVEDGKLRVGECVYDKLLLSGVESIDETTLEFIKAFRESGGRIAAVEDVPSRLRGKNDPRVSEVTGCAEIISMTEEDFKRVCAPEHPLYELNTHGENVFLQSYVCEDGISFILLNMDRNNPARDIRLKINGEGVLEEWNARTGEIHSLSGKNGSIVLNFEPGEEKIYVLRKERKLSQEDFSYRLSEPNIAVLDRADVILEGERILADVEVLKADRKLRERLGYPWRGGEMMQPWYTKKYRTETLKERYPVRIAYRFEADNIPEKIRIAVEAAEEVKVYLNGHLLEATLERWIDTAFTVYAVEKDLISSRNEIVLEYCYGRDSGLEAIYLIGDFGVRTEGTGVHLTTLPVRLKAGNITAQGLPFYSGSITYMLNDVLTGERQITLGEMPAALAVLHGDTDEIIAFSPYRAQIRNLTAIEMVFNRRNTFGPLHMPVSYEGNYGPESFLTEGELWREEAQFISQGLPESIAIR